MGYRAIAAPALVGAASIAVSVCLALPVSLPGHPATVLLLPGREQIVLAALVNLDPDLRLLDIRAGGSLLTVEYTRSDLPAHLSGTGVIALIGVGTFGCHN